MSESGLGGLVASSVVLLVLAACAPVPSVSPPESRTGQVSAASLDALPSDRYEVQPGVHYDLPLPLPDNPEPTYPSAMLTQHIPIATIRVRLTVNDEGHVYDVQALDHVEETKLPYLAAVRSAVLNWQYFPLVKVTEGPGNTVVTVGETSTNYAGQAVKLPFHQDYAFSFEQLNGRGIVKKVP